MERDKSEAELVKAEKESIKNAAEQTEATVLEHYRLIDEARKLEEDERNKKQEEQEAFEAFSLIDSNNDERYSFSIVFNCKVKTLSAFLIFGK